MSSERPMRRFGLDRSHRRAECDPRSRHPAESTFARRQPWTLDGLEWRSFADRRSEQPDPIQPLAGFTHYQVAVMLFDHG